MATSFTFNSIEIVQSLKTTDERTGEGLAKSLSHDGIVCGMASVNYGSVDSRADFLALLDRSRDTVVATGEVPLLHLEMHGAPQGLGFSDGSTATWEDLKGHLTALNLATRNNLVVVLATCDGAYLTSILMPTDRAPVYGLVGARGKIFPAMIRHGFPAFYRALASSMDVQSALRELLRHTRQYSAINAADMFAKSWDRYRAQFLTEAAVRSRITAFLGRLRASGISESQFPGRAVRQQARRLLVDMDKDHRERYRSRFLMLDEFPDEASRFEGLR
jgi:hypothetical protein